MEQNRMGEIMKDSLKFVIVGHVDHGKSTLIGRLLYDTNSIPEGRMEEIKSVCKELGKGIEFGYLMDHLQEEREQAITIDTTQTFFKTKKRDYVIIDAPGHREFIKNMVTGASQAEAAILMVDVNEGVQEQTKRHAYILGMLGLRQVIVAINKMDTIGYEKGHFHKVRNDIMGALHSIKISPSHVIPVSAKKGDNIARPSKKTPWYKGPAIIEALDMFTPMESERNNPLRFPIQDVYKFAEKRIIAGRIESGSLRAGDSILALPSGEKSRIKSIESYKKEKSKAEAGESIGITLEDDLFLDRGDMIVDPANAPETTCTIKGHVFWMDNKPLKKNERVTFKCATQESACMIEKIEKVTDSSTLKILRRDSKTLEEREVGDITIKTEKPLVIENFNQIRNLGRFVLERKNNVCAGGIIT